MARSHLRRNPRSDAIARQLKHRCGDYAQILQQHQMIPSMSRPANPYDNSSCESFMKTLKREEVYANDYRDLEQLLGNIEVFISLDSLPARTPPVSSWLSLGELLSSRARLRFTSRLPITNRGKPARSLPVSHKTRARTTADSFKSVNRGSNQRHIVAELAAAEFHHLFHHPPLAIRR